MGALGRLEVEDKKREGKTDKKDRSGPISLGIQLDPPRSPRLLGSGPGIHHEPVEAMAMYGAMSGTYCQIGDCHISLWQCKVSPSKNQGKYNTKPAAMSACAKHCKTSFAILQALSLSLSIHTGSYMCNMSMDVYTVVILAIYGNMLHTLPGPNSSLFFMPWLATTNV